MSKRSNRRYIDDFVMTAFGDEKANAEMFRMANHRGCVLQRHGILKPWCCAFHQSGGKATDYCDGGPPKAEL